ncbi:MAG: hypothetical protein AB7G11_08325 [Phycisphaerales bacterium]
MVPAAKPAATTRRQPAPRDFLQTGQPDPRPLTGYAVALSSDLGVSHAAITLDQPCVIREPRWAFVSAIDGSRVYPASVSVIDNRHFVFHFAMMLPGGVAFVDVPYQDQQVQNFQGGFVRPGGQWFRKPT